MGHESVEVKDTPIRSEPYVNPFCEIVLGFSEHHAEKDCEEHWCEDTSFFYAVDNAEGDGEVAAVPHLPHLTYVELLQYVQEHWRVAQSCKDFPDPVSADRVPAPCTSPEFGAGRRSCLWFLD